MTPCAAIRPLGNLGAPLGTVVSFAVDVNVEPRSIDDYANGIRRQDHRPDRAGAVLLPAPVRIRARQLPVLGKHLAQTYGTPTELDGFESPHSGRSYLVENSSRARSAAWRAV